VLTVTVARIKHTAADEGRGLVQYRDMPLAPILQYAANPVLAQVKIEQLLLADHCHFVPSAR